MVNTLPAVGGSGSSVDESSPPKATTPFSLEGDVTLRPKYAPGTIRVRKRREVDGKANICGGEDVTDTGSKNRRIHITGQTLNDEVQKVHELADNGNPFILTSATWSGNVLIEEVEIEGPKRYDPIEKQFLWEYTIDAVATGEQFDRVSGVIDDGQ